MTDSGNKVTTTNTYDKNIKTLDVSIHHNHSRHILLGGHMFFKFYKDSFLEPDALQYFETFL